MEQARYRELAPPSALARDVACLWWRDGVPPRVLPDGCVDLIWTGRRLILAGPATQTMRPDGASARALKLGIRIRVGMAAPVLGLPASELRDLAPAISDVRSDGSELEERVSRAARAGARLRIMAAAVGRWAAAAPEPDLLVRSAIVRLARGAPVGEVAARLSISDRQLRRRFDYAVGYSPKRLSRVLRLQRFLALAGAREAFARTAAEAGYADQSHLTRECRELTGLTPVALLAAGAEPAGERFRGGSLRRPR